MALRCYGLFSVGSTIKTLNATRSTLVYCVCQTRSLVGGHQAHAVRLNRPRPVPGFSGKRHLNRPAKPGTCSDLSEYQHPLRGLNLQTLVCCAPKPETSLEVIRRTPCGLCRPVGASTGRGLSRFFGEAASQQAGEAGISTSPLGGVSTSATRSQPSTLYVAHPNPKPLWRLSGARRASQQAAKRHLNRPA